MSFILIGPSRRSYPAHRPDRPGERERGTLESLDGRSIAAAEHVIGQILRGAHVALITPGQKWPGRTSRSQHGFAAREVVWRAWIVHRRIFAIILSLLVLFAASSRKLYGGVDQLLLAASGRAQAYLIPFMLLAIGGSGFISVMRGIELSGSVPWCRWFNIVLWPGRACKEINPLWREQPLSQPHVWRAHLRCSADLAATPFYTAAGKLGRSLPPARRAPHPAIHQAARHWCPPWCLPYKHVVSGCSPSALPRCRGNPAGCRRPLGGILICAIPLGIARQTDAVWELASEAFSLRLGPILGIGGALCLGLSLWAFAQEHRLLDPRLSRGQSVDFKKVAGAESSKRSSTFLRLY